MNAAVPPEQVHSCGWGTEGCPCLRSTAIRQTDVLPRRRSVPGRARIRLHRSRSRDLYWRYQAEKEEKRREEREEERRERGEEKRELLNRWRGMKNEEHCQGSFFLCRIRECVLNYLFQLQHPGFQHYLQSSGRRDRVSTLSHLSTGLAAKNRGDDVTCQLSHGSGEEDPRTPGWDRAATSHQDPALDGSAGTTPSINWLICSCGSHPGTDSAQDSFDSP
ncbi:putative uncharacterized protein LINC02901 isoform X3 [Symphalangus syndactylus]|uniref:putative uncharacterized protein LINC02901 isoform X3 n=1 Tax=Symphalangus syndactylus TaxID=9590 RepID=UPI0030042E4A